MKLELANKKLFEGFEIECYEDISRENGDFFMTRKQIGEALEYNTMNSFHKIIQRNRDIVGNPVMDFLSTTDNKQYETELYSFKQLFQILRFTKQPKANLFMEWATITIQELVTGRAELKFKKQDDKTEYNSKIKSLSNHIDNLDNTLKETKGKLETLIDNTTINSHQAQKINKLGRQRIINQLGGTKSEEYKQYSRLCFKRFWNCLNDTLLVNTYKDINPVQYNDALRFCKNFKLPQEWLD